MKEGLFMIIAIIAILYGIAHFGIGIMLLAIFIAIGLGPEIKSFFSSAENGVRRSLQLSNDIEDKVLIERNKKRNIRR